MNTAWKSGLEIGHGRLTSNPDGARDRYKRTMLIKECIPDRLPPPPIECMDLLVPMKEQTEFEQTKSMVTPGCVGDGYVDFTRFGEGILGGNEECAICQDDIDSNIASLPCGHRFHVDCVQPWITEHNTCPTCRKELQHSLEIYIFEVAYEQVRKRFDEWFISGMCERCQAVNLEQNPMVQVTRKDGMEVTMPLSVAELNGYTSFKSVQGKISQTVNVLLEDPSNVTGLPFFE